MLANKSDAAFLDVATETKTSATLVPVPAPTSTFHLAVISANIATSIPYRQHCFAYHSRYGSRSGLSEEKWLTRA